jgi:hypothetical protein
MNYRYAEGSDFTCLKITVAYNRPTKSYDYYFPAAIQANHQLLHLRQHNFGSSFNIVRHKYQSGMEIVTIVLSEFLQQQKPYMEN